MPKTQGTTKTATHPAVVAAAVAKVGKAIKAAARAVKPAAKAPTTVAVPTVTTKRATPPPATKQILSMAREADVAKMAGTQPVAKPMQGPALLEANAAEARMAAAKERAAKNGKVKAAEPVATPPAKFGKLSANETAAMKAVVAVYSQLSPENLSCDGELSAGKIAKRRKALLNDLKELFAQLGGDVSEEEALAWHSSTQHTKAAAPAPAVKPAAPTTPPVNAHTKALGKAKFGFAQAAVVADGSTAYGYVHADGRAALYMVAEDGAESWTVRTPGAAETGGLSADTLAAVLMRGLTPGLGGVTVPKPTAAVPDGPPPNVVRAVEMLGGLTLQQFDIQLLRGDKHYGHRMQLMKKLLSTDRVLAKDTGEKVLMTTFYSAVGVADGKSAEARAKAFAERCKAISAASRAAKAAAAKADKAAAEAARRRTVLERTVPGTVLPGAPPKVSAAQRLEEAAATARELHALAVTAEPIAAPKPDADVTIIPGEVGLLEDPKNGIVMMQLEKENSQGAICVYNNGSRVAAGVVSPETLKTLRAVPGVQDLIGAANQLLNPLVPTVPVTPTAARYLTAVIHCKELTIMADEKVATAKTTKFAAPEGATKKTAAKKVAAKAAAKAEKTPKAAKPAKVAREPKEPAADRKIKALIKTNPLREGSFCYAQVQAILGAKTVSEAQAKLDKDKANPNQGRKLEVGWLVKKEFISVAA